MSEIVRSQYDRLVKSFLPYEKLVADGEIRAAALRKKIDTLNDGGHWPGTKYRLSIAGSALWLAYSPDPVARNERYLRVQSGPLVVDSDYDACLSFSLPEHDIERLGFNPTPSDALYLHFNGSAPVTNLNTHIANLSSTIYEKGLDEAFPLIIAISYPEIITVARRHGMRPLTVQPNLALESTLRNYHGAVLDARPSTHKRSEFKVLGAYCLTQDLLAANTPAN